MEQQSRRPVSQTDMRVWQREELGIPGLELFGHCRFTEAAPPLASHDHGSCIEIIFVVAGRDSYAVGGQTYELSGNHAFVAMPGERHKSQEAYQGLAENIWLQLDLSVREGFLGLSEKNGTELRSFLCRLDRHMYDISPAFMEVVKGCHRVLAEQGPGLYFNTMLADMLARFLLVESVGAAADKDIEPILAYMQENFRDSNLTLALVAEQCGLSESGLKHKFRRATGDTAGHYLTRLRIAYARQLLEQGATVTKAAMDAGFGSSDYFAVVFKKYTRQTPSAYGKAAGSKKRENIHQ